MNRLSRLACTAMSVVLCGSAAAVGASAAAAADAAPAPGTAASWMNLTTLPYGLWNSDLGVLPNGDLIEAGGEYSPSNGVEDPNPSTEIYSPTTGSWTTASQAPGLPYNNEAGTVGADGDFYVFSGSPTAVQSFNPATEAWATGPAMPTYRSWMSAAALPDGRILSIGGRRVENLPGGNPGPVYAYAPATNAWSKLASMPIICTAMAAATGPNGLVYAVGGDCKNGLTYSHRLWIYNPAANTWSSTGAPMPGQAVAYPAAAFGGNGDLYVMGGQLPTATSGAAVSAVWVYNPRTSKWSAGPALPAASYAGGAAETSSGQVIYAGGRTNGCTYPGLCLLDNVWELTGS